MLCFGRLTFGRRAFALAGLALSDSALSTPPCPTPCPTPPCPASRAPAAYPGPSLTRIGSGAAQVQLALEQRLLRHRRAAASGSGSGSSAVGPGPARLERRARPRSASGSGSGSSSAFGSDPDSSAQGSTVVRAPVPARGRVEGHGPGARRPADRQRPQLDPLDRLDLLRRRWIGVELTGTVSTGVGRPEAGTRLRSPRAARRRRWLGLRICGTRRTSGFRHGYRSVHACRRSQERRDAVDERLRPDCRQGRRVPASSAPGYGRPAGRHGLVKRAPAEVGLELVEQGGGTLDEVGGTTGFATTTVPRARRRVNSFFHQWMPLIRVRPTSASPAPAAARQRPTGTCLARFTFTPERSSNSVNSPRRVERASASVAVITWRTVRSDSDCSIVCMPRARARLHVRVDLLDLRLADQVPDRVVGDEDLERGDAALAVRRRDERLGDDTLQRARDLRADLILLRGREDVDRSGRSSRARSACAACRRRGGRSRPRSARSRSSRGRASRRGGSRRGPGAARAKRAAEARRVGADLALVDDAALVPVQELDRVLDRDDVVGRGRG